LALGRADAEAAIQLLTPIATEAKATPATAYLLQRAYTLLGNEELGAHWQQKVATLRTSQKLQAAFEARSNDDA
jgi:uncharacterized protein YqjF (DUF2071 family)